MMNDVIICDIEGQGTLTELPADEPSSAAGQDDRRDLDEIGEYENFIEQMLLELLEVRHQVLPN